MSVRKHATFLEAEPGNLVAHRQPVERHRKTRN
jgi:hypothetical protein